MVFVEKKKKKKNGAVSLRLMEGEKKNWGKDMKEEGIVIQQ